MRASVFRRLSFGERHFRARNPRVYARQRRRFRGLPVGLLFYGLLLPIVSVVLGANEERQTVQDVFLAWAILALLACVIAIFAESDQERAGRYRRWLSQYDAELKQAEKDDDLLRPQSDEASST